MNKANKAWEKEQRKIIDAYVNFTSILPEDIVDSNELMNGILKRNLSIITAYRNASNRNLEHIKVIQDLKREIKKLERNQDK